MEPRSGPIIPWQRKNGFPLRLSTEASINLADDDELLDLMYEANFRHHYEHSQPYQGRGTGSQQPTRGYQSGQNYLPTQAEQLTGYPPAEVPQGWNAQWQQASQGRGPMGSSLDGQPR